MSGINLARIFPLSLDTESRELLNRVHTFMFIVQRNEYLARIEHRYTIAAKTQYTICHEIMIHSER